MKTTVMKVAMVSAATVPRYYTLLENKLNSLVETSQCFLFYILCGYVEGRKSAEPTFGEMWAKKYGAPVLYISEKTTEKLINKLLIEADYIIFLLDGNPLINKAFMKYKMMGKHGSVIKV